jgi:hypothetical protein
MDNILSTELVQEKIFIIRGRKVMLDNDLAALYHVTTFNLNKAVKRNIYRFPQDFMFQLTKEEHETLIFQFGISRRKHGGRRHLPHAFTEQGVAMLSSVLRSERAIQVNIAIMRAFVQLRSILISHKDIARRVAVLEKTTHSNARSISDFINRYLKSERKKNKIGFRTK